MIALLTSVVWYINSLETLKFGITLIKIFSECVANRCACV